MLAQVLLLTAALLSPAAQGKSAASEGNAAIRRALAVNTGQYTLRAASFVEALTAVGSRFHIRMGIEWVDTPGARSEVRMSWRKATVLEAIEDIVKTQPGYEVRVSDGVLHVLAPGAIPSSENFLLIKIGLFQVGGEPVEAASRRLRQLVRSKIAAANHVPGPAGGVAGSLAVETDSPPLTIHLRNTSVRDVLDAFVRTSNRKIWIVTFSSSSRLTPTGLRKTLTLWNSFPIPDAEQPVWDFLHWGDRLPPLRSGGAP